MQTRIALLMSCVSKLESEGVFKPHYHPYYQLNHILKGEFTYVIEDETFVALPGDTVLIPYNSVHSLTITTPQDGYYYEAKFTTLSKQDRDMCEGIQYFWPSDTFSGALMAAIHKENENLTPFSNEIMVNYLYSILYKFSTESRLKNNVPSKYIEIAPYSEPVRSTIRYIEDNYMEQLTLEGIVSHTDVKKSSLCSRFKDETTLTIFECLMIVRIRKAVELLTFTSMSLAQISQETGFISLTHFNRVFTKHVMIPPGHYRKHLERQNQYFNIASAQQHLTPIAYSAMIRGKIDFSDLN